MSSVSSPENDVVDVCLLETDVMETAQIGSPFLTSAIQYIINVVLTLPAILYVDKWGRRPSLLTGSFVMMVSLFSIGAIEAVYGQPTSQKNSDISWEVRDNKVASWSIVILTYVFVGTYAVTWGPSSVRPLLTVQASHQGQLRSPALIL